MTPMRKKNDRIAEFKLYLKKMGFSENTARVYSAAVRQYFSMYEELSVPNLKDYRQFLISSYSPNTVNARILGINSYIKSLPAPTPGLSTEILENCRLPAIREQQRSFLDNTISNRDYKRFKNALKKNDEMFWYFVVRFLAATGARVSELTQIKAEHLDLGYMDLYSKGGKIRRIYFPDALRNEASSWFHSKGVDAGFLFTNRRGVPMTSRGISGQLKKLAIRYHIPPETVYPHSFRHRFAKNFLERFNDISLLADLMGHESIETTRIYLTRSTKEQKELIDRLVTW